MSQIGKTIGINFTSYDNSGTERTVQRCYGVVVNENTEELIIEMKGVRTGEVFVITDDVTEMELEGHFYFPESEDWVHLELFQNIDLNLHIN